MEDTNHITGRTIADDAMMTQFGALLAHDMPWYNASTHVGDVGEGVSIMVNVSAQRRE